MTEFKVVDLREPPLPVSLIDHMTPEGAAATALRLNLVRAGSPARLVCKVYWRTGEATNVVRLYQTR